MFSMGTAHQQKRPTLVLSVRRVRLSGFHAQNNHNGHYRDDEQDDTVHLDACSIFMCFPLLHEEWRFAIWIAMCGLQYCFRLNDAPEQPG